MTEQYKQLIIKELFSRLPYGIMINDMKGEVYEINTETVHLEHLAEQVKACMVDIYLRPMGDMTEEEIKELYKIEPSAIVYGAPEIETIRIVDDINQLGIEMDKMNNVIDYLNSIHIDHRGLIKKGLALPAPEGMYDKSNNI